MSSEAPITNGNGAAASNGISRAAPAAAAPASSAHGPSGTFGVKSGLAQMLKGGVIMVRAGADAWRRLQQLTLFDRTS